MTIALTALRYMLIVSVVGLVMAAVLRFAMPDAATNGQLITAAIDVAILLALRLGLKAANPLMGGLFALFCLAMIASALTAPQNMASLATYLNALLACVGLWGIAKWFRHERVTVK